MEFKKKLKKRMFWGIAWGVLGLTLVIIWTLTKTENQFLFSFGVALMVIGAMRTVQYRKITRDDKTIRQKELEETDERFLMMSEKAKSWALSWYLTISGFAVIIFSLLGYQDQVLPYAWSICGLTALYWICWFVVSKKY